MSEFERGIELVEADLAALAKAKRMQRRIEDLWEDLYEYRGNEPHWLEGALADAAVSVLAAAGRIQDAIDEELTQ